MTRLARLVATWGNGQFGRLGHGSQSSELFPRIIPQLQGVTAVSAGGAHTAVVTGGACLNVPACCGAVGVLTSSVLVSIILLCQQAGQQTSSVSVSLSLFLFALSYTEDGGLWTFGINNHGQLVRAGFCRVAHIRV